MFEIVRSEDEICKLMDWTIEGLNKGTHYAGASYEDGIMSTLHWLFGDQEESPMD